MLERREGERREPQTWTDEEAMVYGDLTALDDLRLRGCDRIAEYARTLQDISALDLLWRLRETRKALAVAEGLVEDWAVRQMHEKRVVLQDRWTAERRYGKDRKAWQHADVAASLCEALLVDTSSGEIRSGEFAEGVWAARDALMGAANPTWRVTYLRDHGVDPDEFCHATPGRATVQFTPAGEEATG